MRDKQRELGSSQPQPTSDPTRPVQNPHPRRHHPSGPAWRKLTALVITRDAGRCQLAYPDICQGQATTADHITPLSHGGTDHPSNLQAACQPCNQHRGNNPTPTRPPSRQWL